MFRGGDYVDKDGFFDNQPQSRDKSHNLDVSDINRKQKSKLGNAGRMMMENGGDRSSPTKEFYRDGAYGEHGRFKELKAKVNKGSSSRDTLQVEDITGPRKNIYGKINEQPYNYNPEYVAGENMKPWKQFNKIRKRKQQYPDTKIYSFEPPEMPTKEPSIKNSSANFMDAIR